MFDGLGAGMTTSMTICDNNEFKCQLGTQCVPLTAVCDGYRDCYDNSDEPDYCSSGTTQNNIIHETEVNVNHKCTHCNRMG